MQSPPIATLFDFSGKVVIITGSSRGIGAGIALRFAEAGADLVVHYRTRLDAALDTVRAIEKTGCRVVLAKGDLSQPEDVDALLQQTLAAYGHVDVLVNNAGIYPVKSVETMTFDDWQSMMKDNLSSAFLCTQTVTHQMILQGQGGSIINISSIESQNPTPMHAHYGASKAALEQYARTAANELGQYGIRINNVLPGLIWAKGLEENWPEGVDRWLKSVPLRRLGTSADVADACLFLASPAARWITGANIPVDGGMLTSQVY